MTKQQIIDYLSPTKTGPIVIEQFVRYQISGLFNNNVEYHFYYCCKELGITWNSDGIIQELGFGGTNAFTLLADCKLNVSHLQNWQKLSEVVPYDKKDLKNYLQYTYKSKSVEILFIDENWRRDYWFCNNANSLNFSIRIKEEVRFLVQFEPAKYILDFVMDNSPTTRSYELGDIPGKKGIYDYSTSSFKAIVRLKEISKYFSQFGYSFSEQGIKKIGDYLLRGEGATGTLYKKNSSDSERRKDNRDGSKNQSNADAHQNHSQKTKKDCLAVLGLDEDATWEDVVDAKNAMIKVWHPDRWMNDERRRLNADKQTKKVNEAYDELKRYYGKVEERTNNQSETNDKENDCVDPAGFDLFYDYVYGENGKQKDLSKAFSIALEFANKGLPVAFLDLGRCYIRGVGTEKNIEKAIYWLEKASCIQDQEIQGPACFELGCIYYDLEPSPDYNRALNYYRIGAAQNNSDSMMMIGAIYNEGLGVEQSLNEAYTWYMRAAIAGEKNGQYNVAYMLQHGMGVEENHDEAEKWYKKAADQKDDNAAMNLASMLEDDDRGVEAIKWYTFAAEECGNPEGFDRAGDLYRYGNSHLSEDKKKAFDFYYKGAVQGNEHCIYDAGDMLLHGEGIAQSESEAIKILQPLLDNNDPDVSELLGVYYCSKEQYSKAVPLLQSAIATEDVENGYPTYSEAHICLARLLFEGNGIDQDKDKALLMLLKYAYWDNDARDELNAIYEMDKTGVFIHKSIDYHLSMLKKENRAYPFLAECYLKIEDYSQAFMIATECDKKDSGDDDYFKFLNYFILGKCYIQGFGCNRDFHKAFYYFFKYDSWWIWDNNESNIVNYEKLIDGLGKAYCLFCGNGTEISKEKAFEMLNKDAESESTTHEFSRILIEELFQDRRK